MKVVCIRIIWQKYGREERDRDRHRVTDKKADRDTKLEIYRPIKRQSDDISVQPEKRARRD